MRLVPTTTFEAHQEPVANLSGNGTWIWCTTWLTDSRVDGCSDIVHDGNKDIADNQVERA